MSLSVKFKFLLRLALFLSLINLLLSTSRGPFVFTLLSFLFLFCIYFIKNFHSNIFYLRFISISLFIFVSIFYISTKLNSEGIEFGIFQRLINTKESLEKGYAEARNELYDEGIIMFLEAPFFGKSIVLESTSSYPHNSFIEILMATGLFGMFLYLLIIMLVIFNFLYHFKKSKLLYLFFGLFILSFGISLTSGNLYQSVDNWGLITLLLSFNTHKNDHEYSLNDFNNS
jgi:O-antigen ligase